MNVDENAKRYWPLIVCAMIGLIAYFQASAIGSLLSAKMGGEGYVPEPVASFPGEVDTAETAAPILERNPFDSTTGTIEAPDAEDDTASPSGLSECAKGRVVLIAQNEDPTWAFASIDDGSGKAELRRVGDSFGGFVLESLTWDRVYLTHDGKRCFMAMGNALPTGKTGETDEPEDDGDLRSRIEQISDTQFTMDRATMEEILGTRGGLLGQTRVTPEKKGDAVVGLKLGAVKGDSMLHHLGLKRGDILQSMSGTQITSPEKLQAAYERFQASEIYRIRVLRNGVPKQIELRIK